MERSQIFNTILFLLFLFVLDRGIGYSLSSLAQNSRYDQRISQLINGKLDSQAYIVGSSRAARNFDPVLLSEELGFSCFNLGRPGSNITFHKLMIELILEKSTQKPEYIFLTAGDNMFKNNAANDVGGVNFPEDVVQTYVSDDAVLDALAMMDLKNKYLSFASSTYRQNSNLNASLNNLFFGKEKETRINKVGKSGAMLLTGRSVTYDTLSFFLSKKLYDDSIEDKALIADFRQVVEKTNKAGVELIVILTPAYKEPTPGFYEKLKSIAPDLQVMDFRNKMPEKENYYDTAHLSEAGAKAFTKTFSNRLNSYFEEKNN